MATDRSLIGRVLANAGVLLGGRIANAAISLGYIAIAARMLGVREVGVLVLINAFAQLVGEIVKFNSWQTVLHYGAGALDRGDRRQFQRVVRFTVLLDLVSSAVGVAVAVAVALVFGDRFGWSAGDNPAAAIYCLSVAMLTPATSLGLLRLFDRFDLIAAQPPVSSIVRLVGSALALLIGASLNLFLAVWALGSVAAFVYLTGASIIEMRRRDLLSGFRWTGPLTEGMPGAWRFAWATNFSGTLDVSFTHVITLIVGAQIGSAPAALWRIGRQVADSLAKPARLLVPALYPELARLHVTHGRGAMQRLALQVGLLGGAVGTALLLVSAFAGAPLLTLVMGPAFAAAAPAMTWQVAAAVIGIWSVPLEPMLVSIGRPGDALKVRLAVAIVLLASLPFIVRAYGMIGAGAALVAAMGALAIGMFAMLMRPHSAPVELVAPEMACVDGPE